MEPGKFDLLFNDIEDFLKGPKQPEFGVIDAISKESERSTENQEVRPQRLISRWADTLLIIGFAGVTAISFSTKALELSSSALSLFPIGRIYQAFRFPGQR